MGKLPHELEAMVKSLVLTLIAEIVSAVVVLGLLTVRVCAALVVVSNWPAKVRLVGLNAMPATVLLPFPVSATWIGCDDCIGAVKNVERCGFGSVN